MKRKNIRIIALLISIMMSVFLFASCKNDNGDSSSKQDQQDDKQGDSVNKDKDETSGDSKGEFPEPNEMPIVEEKIKLKMFTSFSPNYAQWWGSLNDMPSMQAIEEVTNIEVEFDAVPESDFAEKKNLLFASGNLPDIIFSNSAAADAQKYAVEDDLLMPINDLVEKYAYNFNQWMEAIPAIEEQLKAIDGNIYYMPLVGPSQKAVRGLGFFIREDWMQEFDLEAPETLDDFYNVLKTFKDEDPAGGGDTLPFTTQPIDRLPTIILGSFGTNQGIYQVDGKVKFGPMESEFKDGLIYLNKLYSEGLIASDYLTQDKAIYDANLIENVGITLANVGAGLSVPLIAAGYDDTECWNVFRPMSVPKGPDGRAYWFISQDGAVLRPQGEFITPTNEYPEETMKWIDYRYSKEGAWTLSYGAKGLSWDLDDAGARRFTDYVNDNPDDLSPTEAILQAGRAAWPFTVSLMETRLSTESTQWPFPEEDLDYLMEPSGPVPETLYTQYNEEWYEPASNDGSRQLPPHIKYTPEEQGEINVLLQDIETYVDENLNKFIMGLEPIEKWDDVIKELEGMSVNRLIEIHQDALDRAK